MARRRRRGIRPSRRSRAPGSSMVATGRSRPWGRRKGRAPFTMARARLLRVRICRPGRSAVRSSISARARTLKATRVTAPGGRPRSRSRWRARSVSTRVLPDPAGAMILAPPRRWATAASWSGASSAFGGSVPSRASDPRSKAMAGSTAAPGALDSSADVPSSAGCCGDPGCAAGAASVSAGMGSSGPPSQNAGAPSGSTTSAGPSGASRAPASVAAWARGHGWAAPGRASTLLAKTK